METKRAEGRGVHLWRAAATKITGFSSRQGRDGARCRGEGSFPRKHWLELLFDPRIAARLRRARARHHPGRQRCSIGAEKPIATRQNSAALMPHFLQFDIGSDLMHRFGAAMFAAIAVIVSCIGRSAAQDADIQTPAAQHYQDCMDDAIAAASIITTDYGAIYYSCGGQTANLWFNFLAGTRSIKIIRSNGLWIQRAFPGGTCSRKIAGPESNNENAYSCVILTQTQE
jgi:hypothetical protein